MSLFVNYSADRQYFIGGTDSKDEGKWRWGSDEAIFSNGNTMVQGVAATELRWNSGEPNDEGGNEDCVETLTTFLLNDIPCSTERYYFCEHKGTSLLCNTI